MTPPQINSDQCSTKINVPTGKSQLPKERLQKWTLSKFLQFMLMDFIRNIFKKK